MYTEGQLYFCLSGWYRGREKVRGVADSRKFAGSPDICIPRTHTTYSHKPALMVT